MAFNVVVDNLYRSDWPDRICGTFAKQSRGRHKRCKQNCFPLQMRNLNIVFVSLCLGKHSHQTTVQCNF